MVWVYNSPLTKDETKVKNFLQKNLKQREYLEKIVKLLSLVVYLKQKKYKSAGELRSDILLKKGTPLFDEATASKVYISLSKKTGGSVAVGEYPYTNHVINGFGEYLKSKDPIGVSSVVETGLDIVQLPVRGAKSLLGEGNYELASGLTHGLIETGVSGVNGVAEIAGGPIGFAIVGLFTGFAAGVGSLLAVFEGDFAQSLVHLINFIPGIGPAIIKLLTKMEKMQRDVIKHRKEIEGNSLVKGVVETVFPLQLEDEKEPPEEYDDNGKPEDSNSFGERMATRGFGGRRKTRRNVHRFKLVEKKAKRIRRSHRRAH
jgi:hypothetical protein